MTAGLLVAMAIAVVGVVKWTLAGQDEVKGIAAEMVRLHCDKDVDRAHQDLPKKYVPRTEIQESLNCNGRQLDRMGDVQKVVLQRLEEPRRGR